MRNYMKTEDFAAIIFNKISDTPARAQSNQFYIHLNVESPRTLSSKRGIFKNWIQVSFHYDKYIDFRFQKTRELIQPLNDLHSWLWLPLSLRFFFFKFSPIVPHPGDDEELAKIIRDFGVSNTHLAASKKRGALAAQFVSHCRTASKRNAVVRSV